MIQYGFAMVLGAIALMAFFSATDELRYDRGRLWLAGLYLFITLLSMWMVAMVVAL